MNKLTVFTLLVGMINDVSTAKGPSHVSNVVTVIAEHFVTKCQKENGYDKLYELIKNLAVTLEALKIKELIAQLRGGSSATYSKLYYAAVDKTFEQDSIENKIFNAFVTNLMHLDAYQLFLAFIGSPLGQAGLLLNTATETCKAFRANAAECAVLIDSIGCLEKNLLHQADIGAVMEAAVF